MSESVPCPSNDLREGAPTCVWGGTREFLIRARHDVVWAGDWESDPGDAEILAIAHGSLVFS